MSYASKVLIMLFVFQMLVICMAFAYAHFIEWSLYARLADLNKADGDGSIEPVNVHEAKTRVLSLKP